MQSLCVLSTQQPRKYSPASPLSQHHHQHHQPNHSFRSRQEQDIPHTTLHPTPHHTHTLPTTQNTQPHVAHHTRRKQEMTAGVPASTTQCVPVVYRQYACTVCANRLPAAPNQQRCLVSAYCAYCACVHHCTCCVWCNTRMRCYRHTARQRQGDTHNTQELYFYTQTERL